MHLVGFHYKSISRCTVPWMLNMRIRTYIYIHIQCSVVHVLCTYIYYVYISVKPPLSGSQKQHFKLHNVPRNIAQNTLHVHTSFKMICFPPRRFSRGDTWKRYGVRRFLAGWSACLCLIFRNLLLGASRFVVGALNTHPVVTGLWVMDAHVIEEKRLATVYRVLGQPLSLS